MVAVAPKRSNRESDLTSQSTSLALQFRFRWSRLLMLSHLVVITLPPSRTAVHLGTLS